MLELAALVFTLAVAAGIAAAGRWLIGKDKNHRSARWDEVGGIALLAGFMGGFGLVQLVQGIDEWDWGLAFMPGLILGLFVAILPEMNRAHAVIGWGSFVLGGLFGMFIGALTGVF